MNPPLAPCDGANPNPINDGGEGYYIAGDAGQAAPGTADAWQAVYP